MKKKLLCGILLLVILAFGIGTCLFINKPKEEKIVNKGKFVLLVCLIGMRKN